MGLLVGLAIMSVFVLMGLGINWVSSKYFGVRMVGRGQLISSMKESDRLKINLKHEDPELFNQAIKECERKNYSKTVENIYSELYKIKYKKN